MIPLDITLITIILVTIYGKASYLKINALSQIESLLAYFNFVTIYIKTFFEEKSFSTFNCKFEF
jgi:hypothetical protein